MSEAPQADRKRLLHKRIEIAFPLAFGPVIGLLIGLTNDRHWDTLWRSTAIGALSGLVYAAAVFFSGRSTPRQ